jgi:hypothetical protein
VRGRVRAGDVALPGRRAALLCCAQEPQSLQPPRSDPFEGRPQPSAADAALAAAAEPVVSMLQPPPLPMDELLAQLPMLVPPLPPEGEAELVAAAVARQARAEPAGPEGVTLHV